MNKVPDKACAIDGVNCEGGDARIDTYQENDDITKVVSPDSEYDEESDLYTEEFPKVVSQTRKRPRMSISGNNHTRNPKSEP